MRQHKIKVHDQIHLKKESSVNCQVCKKQFSTSQGLKVHVKSVHDKEKSFTCAKCNKSFSQERILKQHEAEVHMKLKSFTCHICLKSFTRKDHVRAHMSAHNGAMHPCNECDRSLHRKRTQVHKERS